MNAGVAVDTGSSGSVDVLTYEIPVSLAGSIKVGNCVLVPLGNRQTVGYVVSFTSHAPAQTLKQIISIIDTPIELDQDLLDLAKWVSNEYMCSYSRSLLSMLPSVVQCGVECKVRLTAHKDNQPMTPTEAKIYSAVKSLGDDVDLTTLQQEFGQSSTSRGIKSLENLELLERHWVLTSPEGKPRELKAVICSDTDVDPDKLSEKQRLVYKTVASNARPIAVRELIGRYGLSSSAINTLISHGFLDETTVSYRRIPRFTRLSVPNYGLSEQQQSSLDTIIKGMDTDEYFGVLLFGVTASGKTEVYIRAIEYALSKGQSALMLLPEIALTTQVMDIFRSRLGEQVAVLHSNLSAGERYDEWVRIRQGEARVVLGARSAVFAPLNNLGLVIVDEEHEPSYKQDNPPRYHGREVAKCRAKLDKCTLVLGSATPAIESYYSALNERLTLVEMTSRVADRPLPEIIVVDMRKQFSEYGPSIFSEDLKNRIIDRLEKKEQVILFQNRRAYSTFLLCRDCGYVMKCPNCAVSLKLHSAQRLLSCHHCDYQQPAPEVCPNCQGQKIGKFGIGTEKVEEETRKTFPSAKVLRMDRDTTTRKGSHAEILGEFRHGDADILVGTQMIAKGLDFPRVTLVGVISADTSLNLPDYRSSERTFQMLSQVAGRAGRGTTPGEVIIQTFEPDHYAIKYAVNHDYCGFYDEEMECRKELDYPPLSSQIAFTSQDIEEETARYRVTRLAAEITELTRKYKLDISVAGPSPASLSKLRGLYRWQLVARSVDRQGLHRVVKDALVVLPKLRRSLIVDVDPVTML